MFNKYRDQSDVFTPLFPLMYETESQSIEAEDVNSTVLPASDLAQLISYSKDSFVKYMNHHVDMVKANNDAIPSFLTGSSVKLLIIMGHVMSISELYTSSVDSIENMLYEQLVAALGILFTTICKL